MSVLVLLFVTAGALFGGTDLALCLLGMGAIFNLVAYLFSDYLVLLSIKARRLTPKEAPQLFAVVQDLANSAGIPVPKVYLLESLPVPNAMAVGRSPKHAAVGVTPSLLSMLTQEELKGVIAHELAHIIHYDTLLNAVTATFAATIGALGSLARWFALWWYEDDEEGNLWKWFLRFVIVSATTWLIYGAAMLINLAISRIREYLADYRGAIICGNPLWLANALRKIDSHTDKFSLNKTRPALCYIQHMLTISPLSTEEKIVSIFSTHPPLGERIKKLERLASQELLHETRKTIEIKPPLRVKETARRLLSRCEYKIQSTRSFSQVEDLPLGIVVLIFWAVITILACIIILVLYFKDLLF